LWAADDTAGLPLEFILDSEKFKTYPGPAGGLPKVGDFIATDPKGNAWAPFTDGVVKLDPQSGKYSVYSILTKGKSTYGIDSDKDGNIWVAQLTADKVAVFDGETGEASEVALNPIDPHDVPVTDKDRQVYATNGNQNAAPLLQIGPRRLAADKTGDYVWVAEHFANRLAKINIHTRRVTEYELPHAYMMPYAVAVGKDHMVWATVITADRVIKFDPFTEKFTEYELPTRGTEARHIFADNRTDPPTIWIPYDRTYKIARLQLRTGRAAKGAGN
jgi:virginiamycin B lyase